MSVDRIRNLALRAWELLRRVPPVGVLVALAAVLLHMAVLALFGWVMADLIYDDRIALGMWPTPTDLGFLAVWGVLLAGLTGCVIGTYLGRGWARTVLLGFEILIGVGGVKMWTDTQLPEMLILAAIATISTVALLLPKGSRRWFTRSA